jgi:hypothetical protein
MLSRLTAVLGGHARADGRVTAGEATGRNSAGSARSTPTSARKSPPKATATASSSTVLPGLCTDRDSRHRPSPAGRPAPSPVIRAVESPRLTPGTMRRMIAPGTAPRHHRSPSSQRCIAAVHAALASPISSRVTRTASPGRSKYTSRLPNDSPGPPPLTHNGEARIAPASPANQPHPAAPSHARNPAPHPCRHLAGPPGTHPPASQGRSALSGGR